MGTQGLFGINISPLVESILGHLNSYVALVYNGLDFIYFMYRINKKPTHVVYTRI
jgi:hypothetical protein